MGLSSDEKKRSSMQSSNSSLLLGFSVFKDLGFLAWPIRHSELERMAVDEIRRFRLQARICFWQCVEIATAECDVRGLMFSGLGA